MKHRNSLIKEDSIFPTKRFWFLLERFKETACLINPLHNFNWNVSYFQYFFTKTQQKIYISSSNQMKKLVSKSKSTRIILILTMLNMTLTRLLLGEKHHLERHFTSMLQKTLAFTLYVIKKEVIYTQCLCSPGLLQ